jgi:hypothetical protein
MGLCRQALDSTDGRPFAWKIEPQTSKGAESALVSSPAMLENSLRGFGEAVLRCFECVRSE